MKERIERRGLGKSADCFLATTKEKKGVGALRQVVGLKTCRSVDKGHRQKVRLRKKPARRKGQYSRK